MGECISPGGDLQPPEKERREGEGGGGRSSRELLGACGLHGNTRQPGEEAGFENPQQEILKMKVSQRKLPVPWRKAFLEMELYTQTALGAEGT